jgi:hypothetical protein
MSTSCPVRIAESHAAAAPREGAYPTTSNWHSYPGETEELAREVRKKFSYDPETGLLRNNYLKGSPVARKNAHGYLRCKAFGRDIFVHRVAWLLTYGEWPKTMVDHMNRDRMDNRICNLRLATPAMNTQNKAIKKTTGISRISDDHFTVRICANGRSIRMSGFISAEQAALAYEAIRAIVHPEAL